ncbi:tRNA preQ1(34) S-adenosylmethionine ribosyltransferase-isomerase QueA [Desulfobacterota bacterium]|nr:tRNA preQ1(34) S-adenosylmethionine ribosyltransferase-isomerase QueA [Thermodesulfobacteriota bacterium]
MNLSRYDFNLPSQLIADRPRKPRGTSRLLVVDKESGTITATTFDKIFDYFSEKDLFIFNNTKVNPVSLILNDQDGKEQRILLVEEVRSDTWKVLTRKPKEKIFILKGGLTCRLFKDTCTKEWMVTFSDKSQIFIDKYGMMPIPPYLNRDPDSMDFEDYQTVYAKVLGSIAAPTAGLHFTRDLLEEIDTKNISTEFLTLHVGMGTFLPIKVKEVSNHEMHKEKFFVNPELLRKISSVRRCKGRVLTVGTTTLRALEAFSLIKEQSDNWFETDIFINEGFQFKSTDALLTNFHLPKSTLLILISAFLGNKLTMQCYDFAIKEKFNFYSYGDAMLIV